MTQDARRDSEFAAFQERIHRHILSHRIMRENEFLQEFAKGEMNPAQMRGFTIQFSVFSKRFPIAQTLKVANSSSWDEMWDSLEILLNEYGVAYNDGTVEGGRCAPGLVHFWWLTKFAEKQGLAFEDIGHKHLARKETVRFCCQLAELYGNDQPIIAKAASYAVENWAATLLWKPLIEGITKYNERTGANLPLNFFTFHDKLEADHARHTQEELAEFWQEHPMNEEQRDLFIFEGVRMLNAIDEFFLGLLVEHRESAT